MGYKSKKCDSNLFEAEPLVEVIVSYQGKHYSNGDPAPLQEIRKDQLYSTKNRSDRFQRAMQHGLVILTHIHTQSERKRDVEKSSNGMSLF